jgi:Phage integrase family
MRKQIHPAIERLGINKRIGWHTFRHSYSTLLRQLGTDIKVQQDLLRHSSARPDPGYLHTSCNAGQERGSKRGRASPLIGSIKIRRCTYQKELNCKYLGAIDRAITVGVAPFCTYKEIANHSLSYLE